eukprot:1677395-Amphidinium_carterae.1
MAVFRRGVAHPFVLTLAPAVQDCCSRVSTSSASETRAIQMMRASRLASHKQFCLRTSATAPCARAASHM